MKYDEFAFFNQQLAGMLRDGIPLEGALKRLCQEMRVGKLRDNLQAFETDLARGTPIADALKPRQLPELYKRIVLVGVKSGDLPGALTMLADYYQRQNNVWTRLKGLMVYPLIVLFVAFILSCFISYLLSNFIWNNFNTIFAYAGSSVFSTAVQSGLWISPVCIGVALTIVLVAVILSPAREKLRWRLPAFKEASVAQVAWAISLMLKNGVPLDDSLAFAQQLEAGTVAEHEIAHWRQRLASGHGKFSEMTAADGPSSKAIFPSLFIWTVAQSGEDLKNGFDRAAQLYHSRASYRVEMFLYSALPCAILALGAMILAQVQPVIAALAAFMSSLGD